MSRKYIGIERLEVMETSGFLEFGHFRADGRSKTLTRNGQPIPVPAKAFDVLYALLQKPGQTVLKEQLMQEVWTDTFVEEGNLTQMVFLLRKALGESEGGQSLILTVPRQGYRFVGEVSEPDTGQTPDAALTEHAAPAIVGRVQPGVRNSWWFAVAVAVVSASIGWATAHYNSRPSQTLSRLVQYTIAPQENASYRVGKVSPDGRSLALMAVDSSGKARLWVRRLDALAARSLITAEYWPFWSQDSRFIAFAQDGKLRRIDASGGVPQTICNAALVVGGSWNRDETIIFGNGDTISRVQATGGEPQPVTRLEGARGETTHNFPVFLPDGRHFLYTIHSAKRENGGIFLGSLDSPDARIRLLGDISNVEYAPASTPGDGYLLFVRGGALMAQRFRPADLQLRGEAFPVVDNIAQDPGNFSASFSASENGVLLVTSTYRGDQVTWFDRTGKRLSTVGSPGLHFYPQLSPDEQTVAADAIDPERFLSDIWLFPVLRGAPSRLTFHGMLRGIWSPDGSQVAFESSDTAFYTKTAGGTESETVLLEALNLPGLPDDERIPCEWSGDGRFLIYAQRDAGSGYDLWMLPLVGDSKGNRKPVQFLRAAYNEWCGTLSPDSKWIAYASDESGRSEIYVQAFSGEGAASGRKWLISDNGGHWPKWRRDGKELLYLAADRTITGAEVTTGASFRHGAPQSLFPSEVRTPDARFDVTADGRRFLVPAVVREKTSEPARVFLNWTSAIKP